MTPRKKRFLWLLPLVAVFLGLILFGTTRFAGRPDNPVYDGVPLSTHLYTIYAPRVSLRAVGGKFPPAELARFRADETKRAAARKAVGIGTINIPGLYHPNKFTSVVGPEARPLIIAWLSSPPPKGWRLSLTQVLARFIDSPSLTANHQLIAWNFLSECPTVIADPQLKIFGPALLSSDPAIKEAAAHALNLHLRTGMKVDKENALRILFPHSSYVLTGGFEEQRYGSSFAFGYRMPVQSQIREIIDSLDRKRDLIPLFTLELGYIPARVGAAEELQRKPRYPERAVPLLVMNLESTNRAVIESCAKALGAYGTNAAPAIGALSKLLGHPRERIRVGASNAIVAIQHNGMNFVDSSARQLR